MNTHTDIRVQAIRLALITNSTPCAEAVARVVAKQNWHLTPCVDQSPSTLWRHNAAIDIVLIDLDMPRAIELMKRLRNELPAVPLLALSTPQHLGKLQEALLAGASDFIAFPTKSKHFVATVKRVLQIDVDAPVDHVERRAEQEFSPTQQDAFPNVGIWETPSVNTQSDLGKETALPLQDENVAEDDGNVNDADPENLPNQVVEIDIHSSAYHDTHYDTHYAHGQQGDGAYKNALPVNELSSEVPPTIDGAEGAGNMPYGQVLAYDQSMPTNVSYLNGFHEGNANGQQNSSPSPLTPIATGRRHEQSLPPISNLPNGRGRVIAVAGLRGGIGRSTIAVNLALALQQQSEQMVSLVEAHHGLGHLALMMNMHPRRTLADLADQAELDEDIVRGHLQAHESGVHLLAAPLELANLVELSGQSWQRTLGLLAQASPFTVVDTSSQSDDVLSDVLLAADEILLVTTPDLPGLRATLSLMHLLHNEASAHALLHVVLNRADMRGGIDENVLVKQLNVKPIAALPDDSSLATFALNRGVPFVLSHPRALLSRRVQELARTLIAPEQVESTGSKVSNAIFSFLNF